MNKVNLNELPIEYRQDFLSVDKKVAIAADGTIYSIGDKVMHEGDDERKVGTISEFGINEKTSDVIAYTEHGSGRITFLYHV